MAKRLSDSEKFSDPWYRELPPKYKLFWEYLLCSCNHGGVWKPDFSLASFCISFKYDQQETFDMFSDRVVLLKSGNWFIPKFISYQYGDDLNRRNKVHRSVLNILEANEIDYPIQAPTKPLPSPCLMAKDKVKDIKNKSIVSIKSNTLNNPTHIHRNSNSNSIYIGEFEILWEKYPKKLGKKESKIHFRATVKNQDDVNRIKQALYNYCHHASDKEPKFIMNGSTWFNNWEDWVDYEPPDTPEEKKERIALENKIRGYL